MTTHSEDTILVFDLTTFRHITTDSLMPWLPENIPSLKFETIVRLMEGELRSGTNYFKAISLAFADTKVPLPQSLSQEWKTFSLTKPVNNYMILNNLFQKLTSRNKKFQFYYNLIASTTLASLGAQAQWFESSSSANLKKKIITDHLKLVIGLIQRCEANSAQAGETLDIVEMLLIGLKVFYIETALNYQGFYDPYLNYFGRHELFEFETRDSSSETRASGTQKDIDGLIERYIKHYNETEGSEVNIKEGKPSSAGIKKKSSYLFERIHQTEDLLNSIEGSKQSNMDFSVGDINPPDAEKNGQGVSSVPEDKSEGYPSKILSGKEVMAILGIGRTTLYNYSKSGKIPCFTIGGRYKYKTKEILELRATEFTA
ncbi:MAG: hypothetical protein CVT94_16470 [Bacteroidetes bacterium HGW-Bacteroidetes-11]|jgi:predicted DNA-binding transcriptional regulator AlpA|nr:MAG: hypothetical protein CVT94_16470 [Bacteroidetes bacterium HGW-Bacteroidetes-11]